MTAQQIIAAVLLGVFALLKGLPWIKALIAKLLSRVPTPTPSPVQVEPDSIDVLLALEEIRTYARKHSMTKLLSAANDLGKAYYEEITTDA